MTKLVKSNMAKLQKAIEKHQFFYFIFVNNKPNLEKGNFEKFQVFLALLNIDKFKKETNSMIFTNLQEINKPRLIELARFTKRFSPLAKNLPVETVTSLRPMVKFHLLKINFDELVHSNLNFQLVLLSILAVHTMRRIKLENFKEQLKKYLLFSDKIFQLIRLNLHDRTNVKDNRNEEIHVFNGNSNQKKQYYEEAYISYSIRLYLEKQISLEELLRRLNWKLKKLLKYLMNFFFKHQKNLKIASAILLVTLLVVLLSYFFKKVRKSLQMLYQVRKLKRAAKVLEKMLLDMEERIIQSDLIDQKVRKEVEDIINRIWVPSGFSATMPE